MDIEQDNPSVIDIDAAIRRGIEQAHEGRVTHRSFLDDLTSEERADLIASIGEAGEERYGAVLDALEDL